MSTRIVALAALAILCVTGCGGGGNGGTGTFALESVASGLTLPTAFAFAPDSRLFVAEMGGALKLRTTGGMSTILQLAVASDFERGLLGIALDPQFAANGYVYLYYTATAGSKDPPPSPANRISRFTMTGQTIDPSTESILLDGIPSVSGNHNAGCLRFGPDQKLYIGTGDGGVSANAQSLMSLSGKILRINRDGTIPPDNPFAAVLSARGEIYCLGLRNPFRFAFRPSNDALVIADVGSSAFEEVNIGVPGGNYGWPNVEGPGGAPTYIDPVYSYAHDAAASITGGAFLGTNVPSGYGGTYIFADFMRNTATRLTMNPDNTVILANPFGPPEGLGAFAEKVVDIGPGPEGDLHFLSLTRGDLRRLRFD